jgi:hypothetical protein
VICMWCAKWAYSSRGLRSDRTLIAYPALGVSKCAYGTSTVSGSHGPALTLGRGGCISGHCSRRAGIAHSAAFGQRSAKDAATPHIHFTSRRGLILEAPMRVIGYRQASVQGSLRLARTASPGSKVQSSRGFGMGALPRRRARPRADTGRIGGSDHCVGSRSVTAALNAQLVDEPEELVNRPLEVWLTPHQPKREPLFRPARA